MIPLSTVLNVKKTITDAGKAGYQHFSFLLKLSLNC